MSASYPPDSPGDQTDACPPGPSPDVPPPFPGLTSGRLFDAESTPERFDQPIVAQLADERTPAVAPEERRRRVRLPVVLFVLTCFSTFFVGATNWSPLHYLNECLTTQTTVGPALGMNLTPLRRVFCSHWDDGLLYMSCVLGILLAHEMGHFVMTVVYRVRSSYPFFIPLPISPLGTMGAVIAMDGRQADRKEIFDIGLAGPLAGLVVAIPILIIGAYQLDLSAPAAGGAGVGLPLVVQWLLNFRGVSDYQPELGVPFSQLSPLFMAGWVGLLVTGLNMMPVSQLDGGHVTYGLLGKWSHWTSRGFLVVVFAYLTFISSEFWWPMAILVLIMGPDHPPTRNDNVRLGLARTIIGWLSLLIPLLCFAPRALILYQ